MAKETILIVEDEKDISEMIRYNLGKEGYNVIVSDNGVEALSVAKKKNPDLILLDLMLPDMDGFDVCMNIRKDRSIANIFIIMLTAKVRESDKVAGLELGADDYVTKPFSPRELIARIRSVLRRKRTVEQDRKIKIGEIYIDSIKHKVLVSGQEASLTHTEFKLLEFMAGRPGIVLSREQILNGVFGYDSESYDRTVDAHIKSLRKKLGPARDYIETVRGTGYRFKDID